MRAAKPGQALRDTHTGAGEPHAQARGPSTATLVARARRHRRALALGLLALLLAITALWLQWPQTSRPTIAGVLAAAEHWRGSPWAPVVALACFAIGGLIVFPVNLLTAATILVFGPLAGSAYALAGSVLSAAIVYELGRLLPASLFARVMGTRGARLRAHVVGHGFAAVALVRLVPIAPYSVVSLVAGVARLRRAGYLLGTAVGMAPGVVLYALFADRARAAVLDPHPLTWLALVAAIALMALAALLARLHARRVSRDGG